jgi:hypothetical protein
VGTVPDLETVPDSRVAEAAAEVVAVAQTGLGPHSNGPKKCAYCRVNLVHFFVNMHAHRLQKTMQKAIHSVSSRGKAL